MILRNYLNKFFNGERVAVLGIGSELCGDDSAGMLCAAMLKRELSKYDDILVISASTAPENFTGEICDFKPSSLILIDAADLGLNVGEIGIINPADIKGISFSTHMLPLSMLVQYFEITVKCSIGILGIQYKQKGFGDPVCEEVQTTVGDIVDCITELTIHNYGVK